MDPGHLYEDRTFGRKGDRPQLAACLKALRQGDTLLGWKLNRLGRTPHHLGNSVHDLIARGVGLEVLAGQGTAIDTTLSQGTLVSGIFAALAEFERRLISERTKAGLESAGACGLCKSTVHSCGSRVGKLMLVWRQKLPDLPI